jgi:transposase
MQIEETLLENLDNTQLLALVTQLSNENRRQKFTIGKLTHEMAVLKRLKFAARSEAFAGVQRSPLEDNLDFDLAAIAV